MRAGLLVAPVAVPAGLAVAGALWAWRIYAITTGLAGLTASAPIEFDARQWRRQVRAARGRAAAPGTVPLLARAGLVVIGPVIRAIRHPWRPVLAVPYTSFGRHSVIIGSSGSGKTNLMMRLWAGWYAAAPTAYAAPGRGPAAAGRAGLQGRPGRPGQSRADPPPAARRRRPAGGDLAG